MTNAPTPVNRLRELQGVAAIFDMDGLLLESESLWRVAEREKSAELGLNLTDSHFDRTMGVRMRDVAQMWFEWSPWSQDQPPTPSTDEVAQQVIDRVVELVAGAEALPGVEHALSLVEHLGMRVALCSSSDLSMIHSVVDSLGLSERFEVTHSAADNVYGKPHPEPYLSTASKLGVPPRKCVAFEDTVTGAISAKSAGMSVIAVPDPAEYGSVRFGFCDAVLQSLADLQADHIADLLAPKPLEGS